MCFDSYVDNIRKINKTVSDFRKRPYFGYFGIRLGNQDKTWTLYQICKTCTKHLCNWIAGK